MALKVTAQSPSQGYITWTGASIAYKGSTWTIADGNTNYVYVYWLYSDPTHFYGSNTYPTLGSDDILVFVNKNGVPLTVPNTTVIDGSLVVPQSITANAIAADTITASQIAAGAISTNELAANAVTASTVAAGAIGTSALAAGAVVADRIATGTITATQIAAGTITSASGVIGSIDAGSIKTGTLSADRITALGIPDTRSANNLPSWYRSTYGKSSLKEFKNSSAMGIGGSTFGTLTTTIPWNDTSGGVVTQTYENGGVNYYRVGSGDDASWGAWSTTETTAGAQNKVNALQTQWAYINTTYIDGGKIYTSSITANQIAAGAITASELAAGAVTANAIAANAIGANAIAAGAVTADKISVTSLSALSANLGTVTAGTINGVSINGATISSSGSSGSVSISADTIKVQDATSSARSAYMQGATMYLQDSAASQYVALGWSQLTIRDSSKNYLMTLDVEHFEFNNNGTWFDVGVNTSNVPRFSTNSTSGYLFTDGSYNNIFTVGYNGDVTVFGKLQSSGSTLTIPDALTVTGALTASGNLSVAGTLDAGALAEQVGYTSFTPVGGWVPYVGGYRYPAYYVDAQGYLHMNGIMKSGANGTFFTLPSSIKVTSKVAFNVNCGTGYQSGYVTIDTSGVCQVYVPSGANGWVVLDGISMRL